MLDELDPIKFVENYFNLEGKPFVLINDRPENARHYLRHLYNVPIFYLPKVKKSLVIVKGRQVEMTTTVNNIIAYLLHNIPYFTVLYVVPKSDQAKRFSETRFDPLFRDRKNTEILKALKNGTYNKSVKEFANGSVLYVYAAADKGDNIRSISAHAIIKDEYQDFDKDAEEVIDETLTHSPWKINISLGTPKYTNSRFHSRWKSSTQNYYHLLCPKCNQYFVLGLDNLVKGFIVKCSYCGYEEDKRLLVPKGKWIASNPEADTIGYHLSQLYVPYITKEDIYNNIKKREAEGADVAKYVKNEILGEFYEGHVQKLTPTDIMASFNSNLPYDIYIPVTTPVFMGIDWGGFNAVDNDPDTSYTVVSVGAFNKDGKLFLNYIEIIDSKDELAQVDRISYLMQKYHVNLAVADVGYGKIKNMELMKRFPGRFKTCKYLQGSATTLLDKNPERNNILVNRDYSLEELYSALKYGKLAIPKNAHTEWIIDHFLNFEISIEENGDQVYKKFNKIEGKNRRTDAVHSINYMRIAAFSDPMAAEHSFLISAKQAKRPSLPVLAGTRYDADMWKLKRNFNIPLIRRNMD